MSQPWLGQEDNGRLLTCVALSRAVYASNSDQMIKMLNDELAPYSHGLTELTLSENCLQQYVIGLKPETKEMYVAFRGTMNMKDIFVDLRIFGLPNSPYGCFHDGFASRANLIHLAPFARFLEQYPGWNLVITGHSLGGAIATIVATIFLGDPRISEKADVFCITFGAPLCCDANAAQFFEQRHAEHFSHYINDQDIVPRLLSMTESLRATLFSSQSKNKETFAQQLGDIASKEFANIFSTAKASTWGSLFSAAASSSIIKYIKDSGLAALVGNTIAPRFVCMGKVYSMFTVTDMPVCMSVDAPPMAISTPMTTRLNKTETARFFNLDLSFKGANILASIQDHSVKRYSEELWNRLKNIAPKRTTKSMAASQSSSLARFFYFLPQDFIEQTQEQEAEEHKEAASHVYWSIVRTPLNEFEELQLELHGAKAPLIVGVCVEGTKSAETLSKPQLMSADSSRSFQLLVPLIPTRPRPTQYEIRIFGHFNSVQAIFQASSFVNAVELKGRLHQISALDLFELYKLAFTFSLFTDERAAAPTVQGEPPNYQAKVLEIMLRIQKRFIEQNKELGKNPSFVKHIKGEIEQVALGLQIDVEKVSLPAQKSVADLLVEPPSPLGRPSPTPAIEIIALEKVQKDWQEGKIVHSTDAIIQAAPGLLATTLSIFQQLKHAANFKNNKKIATGCAVASGFILVLVGCPFLIASMPWAAGAAAVSGIVGLGGSVFTVISLIRSLHAQYLQMLREWALSLGLQPARIRNDPYYLEKAISELYYKKFRGVTHAKIMESWLKFFPCGSLSIVAEKNREYCIKVLESIADNLRLRELLAFDVGLGVIGPGKSGKSTLLETMLGCASNPDPIIRTTDLSTFRVHPRFFAVDFPHMTASLDKLRLCYSANHSLVHCVVVVLAAIQGGDDADGEQRVVDVAKRFAQEGTKVLYCFNGADFMLPFRSGRQKPARNLIAGTAGRNVQLEQKMEKPEITVENVQASLARCAQNYSLPLADCLMTAFNPYPEEDNTTKEYLDRQAQLSRLGIYSASEVKEKWLAKVLGECGLTKEEIGQIVAA